MDKILFKESDNTQDLSIDERRYYKPSDVPSEEVSTSNKDFNMPLKSFMYSQRKDNQIVKIKLNLKLAEQIEKVQRLKAIFE